MKVSIIVPVYNVEQYIVRCFDSIKDQTYSNIECIFVDDCSPDNCSQIVENKIALYLGRIEFKILRHSVNKGLSGARNTGTLASTGEYIYYLDSDDEIKKDCIQNLVSMAQKYNGVEIVQGNTQTLPEPELDWRDIRLNNYPEYVDDPIWIKTQCFAVNRMPVNAWNKLIKRCFLIDNGLLFREGLIHEDEHWLFFVSKKIKTIAFHEDCGYVHYVVPGSIMQTGSNTKSIESWYKILNEISLEVDDCLAALQKRYIFYSLKSNMLRIDFTSPEKKIALKYRSIVKRNFILAAKSMKIIDCLFLSVFLMPPLFYRNIIGRKLSELFLKLV